jgi:hypothetical protein
MGKMPEDLIRKIEEEGRRRRRKRKRIRNETW